MSKTKSTKTPQNKKPSPPKKSPIIASKSSNGLIPKKTLYLLIILAILALALAYLRTRPKPQFLSFEDCEAHSRSIIRESNPPVCMTYTGQEFTKVIPTSTPAPTPTPIVTTPFGWNAITQSYYSIDIPPDWQASSPATSSGTTTQEFTNTPTASDSAQLSITINQIQWNQSLGEYILEEKLDYASRFGGNSTWDDAIGELDSEPATLITNDSDSYPIYAKHPDANIVFKIELSKNLDEYESLSTDIYRTFKFITPIENPDTPNSESADESTPSATL